MRTGDGISPVISRTNDMHIQELHPSRRFAVNEVEISHLANIELEPDEQITFVSQSGTEFDVVRKSWGYYATPSLNGRLPRFGLRAALVCNKTGKLFLLLIEKGREDAFYTYLDTQQENIVCWLDNDSSINVLLGAFKNTVHDAGRISD